MSKGRALAGCVLWLLPMAAGMIWGDEGEWLAVLPAILLHELGHVVAARLCGVRVTGIRVGLWEARMGLDGVISYCQELVIALGGPLVNGLCALILWMAQGESVLTSPWGTFFGTSLGLAVFNLLPIGTLDGGRMLGALLSRWISPTAALTVLRGTTACGLALSWLLAAYALLRGAPVLSFFIFICGLVLKGLRQGEEG